MPIISEQILYCILNNLDKRHVFKFKYECKYPCCTALGWQGLNIWMCSSRTDGSLARARHQRVTSDPCFHFFCILSASGKSTRAPDQPQSATSSGALMSLWSNVLILGGFGSRWKVAMMESDSLLAPLDATLSACWLRCGQPLPIPTDQQHVAAICVALTWKNCFATSTVGYLCSCRLLMPTGLLILYLVDVTWITWCNIPWMSDLISFIWQCIS